MILKPWADTEILNHVMKYEVKPAQVNGGQKDKEKITRQDVLLST